MITINKRGDGAMGLLDVLRGMSNGPRGQTMPSSQGGSMSPITMGLLALLAYKAFKGGGPLGGLFGGNNTGGVSGDGRMPPPGGAPPVLPVYWLDPLSHVSAPNSPGLGTV